MRAWMKNGTTSSTASASVTTLFHASAAPSTMASRPVYIG